MALLYPVLAAGDVVVTANPIELQRLKSPSISGSVVVTGSLSFARTLAIAGAIVATSSSLAAADVAKIVGISANVTATSSTSATAVSRVLLVGAAAGRTSIVANATSNFGASSSIFATSAASINSGLLIEARSIVSSRSTSAASADLVRTGMTICDVIRDILLSWGMEQPCSAPKMAQIAAVNVLNQSLQVIWNQAKDRDYWTKSNISVSVDTSGEALLTDAIQNIVGPARISNNPPLIALSNGNEADSFTSAFLENSVVGGPVAYYVEREYQAGGEPVRCTLRLAPAPASTVTVNMEVVLEAPRFNILDLDSCPLCPIPHKYVESLLLPICRYMAMHSHLFIQRDRTEIIASGYAQARQLLDIADPLPGMSGENAKYRKEVSSS